MVARPRVDDSCTQKSVRYVTRVKHELNLGAPLSQDFANKTSKVHEDATTILFSSFEEFGLPDVVKMWRLGVERVLKEVGAKLHNLHIVESLVHSFTFAVFF